MNLLILLNWLGRRLRLAIRIFLALLALYLAAALLLGLPAQHRAWQAAPNGIVVTLYSNGVHSGLVLPVRAAGVDWRQLFPPQQLRSGALQPNWDHILLGWGEERFYLETPTLDDLKAETALLALSGLNQGALHVEYLSAPQPSRYAIPLALSPSAYARLAAFVRASVKLDQHGHALWLDSFYYSYNDAFYEAHGRFSLFYTCNQWTRDALAAAGVRVPLWAPFDTALFWHLR